MERKNYYLVDIVKLICAVLVVAIHTGPFLSVNETLNYFVVQILGRIAVPFFFVASAFLFFRKLDYVAGLKSKENLRMLRKYILRLLRVYVIWTIIYLIPLVFEWMQGGIDGSTIPRFIRNFLFTGSYYHLWFLPAMMFSTCLVYALLMKFKTTRVIEVGLVLYIIGMLVNVYGSVLLKIPLLGDGINFYLKIFETTRNGLFFGMIYTTIGFYIATSRFALSKSDLLKRTLVCFVLLFIEGFFIKGIQLDTPRTSMYLTLLPFMFYFFLYVISFDLKFSERYITFRACSTLIYFSHILFKLILDILPFNYNSLVYFIIVLVLAVDFAYIVYTLSKKSKFAILRYLI
ncbi:peptidoglycan/LPS O-acetylase OafA/YrhL [Breznakia sp. PF5-3]|uniref:acyltransferase family protein n=1 Tax=unclassified Breznakia TaxID=2623764 RepID=UPI002406481B|nr:MULTISPECIES: acyltransferase [unclassified Breznakia]MDL2276530.1 acyltransferase [Breznakia sp. OttesenSCG-928-G09]MDF9824600.1 peptidoglycan/LPS O-acetylase OafA/YrhL [Breznakia sp. PM6-1]MDF9835536.1 peptidoglycan/LPS O-acetylase OafA/YrhL [Breznakia sp. PF5-3]MDF9837962.1 peptidoglycan/LPS O-acetylase OafA/YrhL [Breznakia sp. PFB2-8]MDF9859951.1 peptidoglycan/LPS O-acetylase OafA/YrhL [Breznakia sp. PH5-24]